MTRSTPYRTGCPLPPMPGFCEFYEAINGRPPFPWQARLAREVAERHRWPDEVGVPTGLGKTACLDVAVWWLASEADRPPTERHAPTRIWWVVNRRLLVDSTAEHADAIVKALEDPGSLANSDGADIVPAVADRLRSLSAGFAAPPLDVIRMRGGVASRSPTDPSRPTIVLCTLPMYGSRLLFRGYGSRIRPIDAAMAGTDSLVLLDEAHLAPHLKRLIPALAECAPTTCNVLNGNRSRPSLVALTATGDECVNDRFDLDGDDLSHPVVRQRLDAAKPLELRVTSRGKRKPAADHLADTVYDLIRGAKKPASFLVFANTPKTARDTFRRLRDRTDGSGVVILLLTGRVREREAEKIRARLLNPADGMAVSRNPGAIRERHLVVVATQTLEVGADLDAEYLVTEQCGVRALTQRLGRMNRMGRYPDAHAVYLHMPEEKNGCWQVYDREPRIVRKRLEEARVEDGVVHLSPGRVADILGAPCDDPGRAPEIMPEILREWTKTTTPPEGEAPVEPYFTGIRRPGYAVSLVWRIHVPVADGGTDKRLWPPATDREAIRIPINEAREVLKDDGDLCRLADDGVTLEQVPVGDLRPGDCIVLRSDRGLMDEHGWNPEAKESVVDVSLAGHGLPLDAGVIERLCGVTGLSRLIDTALGKADEGEEVDPADRVEAAKEILDAIRSAPQPSGWNTDEWADFVESLSPDVVTAPREIARLPAKRSADERPIDDFDERSTGESGIVELDPHCRDVACLARRIAHSIGLPDDLGDVVACAGLLHDIGKADRRFQRWLDPEGNQDVAIAKSNAPRHRWEAMRRSSGWPRGGRHEALSARLSSAWFETNPQPVREDLRDLVIHLVISHHGKGRPLVPPVADDTNVRVVAPVQGVTVEAPSNLGIVDWEQPGRFRRLNERFGPWGLALLEAVVICSDHAVSGGNASGQDVAGPEEVP